MMQKIRAEDHQTLKSRRRHVHKLANPRSARVQDPGDLASPCRGKITRVQGPWRQHHQGDKTLKSQMSKNRNRSKPLCLSACSVQWIKKHSQKPEEARNCNQARERFPRSGVFAVCRNTPGRPHLFLEQDTPRTALVITKKYVMSNAVFT